MKRLIYYIKLWLIMSKNSFLIIVTEKLTLGFFLTGKILRFSFFFAFIYFLLVGASSLAGYNQNQAIFFFLTYNVIETISQFFFREVYRFRQLVVSGDFDLILVKPFNSLFRVLAGGADIIDLITIPPLIYAVYYVGQMLGPTTSQILLYILLIFNSLILATSFHITVVSLGIITLEIDHTIMIYRDITNLGRLPIDIYRQPLQGAITYFLPIGIMLTFPAKALMGILSTNGIIISFLVGALALFLSLRFWNFALKKYTSASS